MLVDCGSPSTIVGVENFRQIKQQYTPMIQSGLEYSRSNKHRSESDDHSHRREQDDHHHYSGQDDHLHPVHHIAQVASRRSQADTASRRSQADAASRNSQAEAAGGGLGQNERVWKCDFCICSHPRWKDCGCDCVNHRRENCPNPDPAKAEAYKKRKAEQDQDRYTKHRQDFPEQAATERGFLTFTQGFTDQIAQEESEYEILTLVATKVREVEAEFQPLHKLFQALEINTDPGINVNSEMIYLEDNITKHWQQTEETSEHEHKLTMLVDCGSPSTIVGVENFRQIKQQYTPMIQSGFEYSRSNKHHSEPDDRRHHSEQDDHSHRREQDDHHHHSGLDDHLHPVHHIAQVASRRSQADTASECSQADAASKLSQADAASRRSKQTHQEIELEDLIPIPASQQPPVITISEQPLQPGPEVEITQPDLTLDVPPSLSVALTPALAVQNCDAQNDSARLRVQSVQQAPQ